MPRRTSITASLALACLLCAARAQFPSPEPTQEPDPQPAGPTHTLHVYMDLIQVPVLVLDSEMGRLKQIDPSKFLVSLDAGPTFRPRNVRQEADDPIALGILLDVNGEPDVMPRIGAALSALAPGSLSPNDRVSIFTLDCTLTSAIQDAPADPETLKAAVDLTLEPWLSARKAKHPEPCPKRAQLWDSMRVIVNELGQLPGRRVLLAVTDGKDHGSVVNPSDILTVAQLKGVAVFGYSPSQSAAYLPMTSSAPVGRRPSRSYSGAQDSPTNTIIPNDPFGVICQFTGGMVISADSGAIAKKLARFTTLVRERYILEFPRARNETPGMHKILITIPTHPTAYIRPTGVSILMSDEAAANDPNTIPRDISNAPEIGTRKSSKSPH